MKKHLVLVVVLFCLAQIAAALFCTTMLRRPNDSAGMLLVDFNELTQLAEKSDASSQKQYGEAAETFREKLESNPSAGSNPQKETVIFAMCAFSILFTCGVFIYVYFKILRPFYKLKGYAAEIAKGNLDARLDYERQNFFGEFTWAFSSMRKEILKSRACEREAIQNNKTVVATLSHDIKTPIASLRMYAEALGAQVDRTPEQHKKYIDVILKKCDEVTRLTNDLFLHSLSLDKLRIVCERTELAPFLTECISGLSAGGVKIHLQCDERDIFVNLDRRRFEQVIENFIGNAVKYAPGSRINVYCGTIQETVTIHIRDYGTGIPDADMPFVFEKFYRGKNAGEVPGSGLGLYIVKYIMEQMDGRVHLFNHQDGLEAVLELPLAAPPADI